MTFEELGLSPVLLRTVAEEGYTEPTPVQQRAIPIVLSGRDILAAAQTGTGKTAAFTLPILDRLAPYANTSFSPARHPVRCLVLTPTRELAVQVSESVKTYGRHVPLRAAVVYGGVPLDPQIKELRGGIEILVATPGRLLDLVGQKAANLAQAEILVLDEADRMLDMGFMPDIRRILDLLLARKQTLLFSATFSDDIKRLAGSILNNPETVEVSRHGTAAETVNQLVYPVDRERKEELLAHLIIEGDWHQVLVFTRTKLAASRLASWLDRHGVASTAIHSDRAQSDRTKALEAFKAGEIRCLVATDVAARGLDIDALPHVVNFELPWNPEDYVHRVGRTGRAGASGNAISLVTIDEADLLRSVQRLLQRAIDWEVEPGFEPRQRDAQPLRAPRGAGSSSSGGRSRSSSASSSRRRTSVA
ncbi:MAG TPA: DEAD/DEAH box helicase [Candidatus Limnocylindrales bacterium]|nr:DEAD/DEAH box helicase [Candidatus Limnocylindrales bacterium]